MNRKTFIKKTAVGVLFGIPAVSMLGCSGDDNGNGTPNPNPEPTAKSCVENGTKTSVATVQSHTHSLTVPKEDVSAAAEKTYNLSQSDNHNHQVTISATEFQTLKDSPNQSITITSTSQSGHTHNVTVSCA